MSLIDYHIPNDDEVSADDIHPGADLEGADLSEADLEGADLSKADLEGADLSEANLRTAKLKEAELLKTDLSRATLMGAQLSEADLRRADLSEANLGLADLSEANLAGADLSESDLVNATLTDVLLWDATLSDTLLSRGTDFDPPGQRIRQYADAHSTLGSRYDAIARANHELRTAYSENGLLQQARDARVRERKARRNEALAEDGWRGTAAWAGSMLSRGFTGYGVQLLPVVLVMSLLFLGSAAVYAIGGGMPIDESLYYSIVTFTTSPPQSPSDAGFGLLPAVVAGIETIAGTTAIIFLGYVLGTRERV